MKLTQEDFTHEELQEREAAWQAYLSEDDPGMDAAALKAELFG